MAIAKKTRVAVLGATLDTTNMGVGALAAGTIRCVLNVYPEADIRLLDYAKAPSMQTLRLNGREISIPIINMRFSKRLYLSNNIAILLLIAAFLKVIPSKRLRQWIGSKNACLREIQEMDLLVSIAGGDSFSDIYGIERLLYVSLPQILVLLLGKKLVLLPQTIGPFRGSLAKIVARFILRHAEKVYSRDYRGLEALRELVGQSHVAKRFAFCYDVGFVLEPFPPAHIDLVGFPSLNEHGIPLVGLNVSGLLWMGGYTRDNMFGLRADYRELIESLVEFLISKKGASVLLVPHVFGSDPDSESDTGACERVYEELKDRYDGRLGLLRGRYNQNEIKHVIGRCDFFVGARMHACIAAVSQCIPAVCVAYSDKFIGVMETIGIESIVADARRMSISDILQSIGETYEQRTVLRKKLEAKMPEVREVVLNLFKNIDVLYPKMEHRKYSSLQGILF
jgi:colanic acid/amylovoran biosynthesis protein